MIPPGAAIWVARPAGLTGATVGAHVDEQGRARVLARCALFAGLPEADLSRLASAATPRHYRRGQLLFCEGGGGRPPSRADPGTAHVAGRTIRRLTGDAADLVFLDVPRRVAKLLLGMPTEGSDVVHTRMTQTELVERVGASRQSLNAALQAFQRRGWLTAGSQ